MNEYDTSLRITFQVISQLGSDGSMKKFAPSNLYYLLRMEYKSDVNGCTERLVDSFQQWEEKKY